MTLCYETKLPDSLAREIDKQAVPEHVRISPNLRDFSVDGKLECTNAIIHALIHDDRRE